MIVITDPSKMVFNVVASGERLHNDWRTASVNDAAHCMEQVKDALRYADQDLIFFE